MGTVEYGIEESMEDSDIWSYRVHLPGSGADGLVMTLDIKENAHTAI